LLRRAVLERSPSLLATGRTAFIEWKAVCVASVSGQRSPMLYHVWLALMPFKPVLLSHRELAALFK
jgi:hypothetical protein